MPRRFNTAGPNDPQDHYTLPVLARLPDVRGLIDEKRYFAIHAPRQAGKTTALLTLARELTGEGRFAVVVLSMESGAPFREDVGGAEDAILDAWRDTASRRLPAELRPPAWPSAPPGRRISRALQAWTEAAPRPLVVLLEGIDALEDAALVSVLRQLRDGFPDRPHHFPWSLILAGMRDVPDYKIAPGPAGRAGAESLFDIRSDSLTLRDFSHAGVEALYREHTEDTGQVFLPEAINRVYRLTRGQPWLVNALARQIVEVLEPDRTNAIGAYHVEAARELLVQGQKAHFDSLAEQLHEPRLRAILAPMVRGETLGAVSEEDRRLALDLGLVRSSDEGALAIANPIYRDVLVRLLASGRRAAPPHLTAAWIPAEVALAAVRPPAEAPPLEETSIRPIALNPALTGAERRLVESFPPEELTEWFRPVSSVLPDLVGEPEADDEGAAATDRAWRRRSRLRRTMAVAGAVCALVAAIAWLAGSGARPAAATPVAASSVASVPEPAETPRSAPEPRATTAAPVPPEPAPSAPPVARHAGAPPEPAPQSRVVPSLPALPPPDEEQIRRQLEPKVWSGEASIDEIRMLKAICSNRGDRRCRDRAYEMLKRKQQ